MPHNRNHKAFDMMKNATRGNMLRRKSPMMGTREAPGPEMDQTGYGPAPRVPIGQQQNAPGWQSSQASWVDYTFGGWGGTEGGEMGGGYDDYGMNINNMNDLADWYNAGGWSQVGMDQGTSFYDWFSNQGGQWADTDWNAAGYVNNPYVNPNYGGGSQGDPGDLGVGSYFAGGGMFSNDPGSSASGASGWGDETSIIDPSVDQQCLAAFQTYGQEDGSYEEFANAMC